MAAEAKAGNVVRRVGPPRWGNPMPPEKGIVRRGPLPADLLTRLESATAAADMSLPAETIGLGVGIEGAPGAGEAPGGAAAAAAAPDSSVMADFVRDQERKKREAYLQRVKEYKERAPKEPSDAFAPRAPAFAKPKAPGAAAAAAAAPALDADFAVEIPKPLADLAARFKGTDYSRVQIHPENAVTKRTDVFVPPNRRYFKDFIIQSYWRYKLKDVPAIPDPDACAKAAEASKKEVKTFQYQSFVRDYMQRPSPYRGVLVYHGLGSGKTCTSIAALEALYQEHQRPIIIMTPASLQPNYRDEITKCGPYIYRIQNHWTWIPVPDLKKPTPEAEILMKVVGLSRSTIKKRGGGWIPDPAKAPNFETLSIEQRRQIQEQIVDIMNARFTFINYNGVTTETVREWACAEGPKKFDGATIIIDEVHNLIRTINNSNLEYFYKEEPRTMPDYKPKFCGVAAKKYNKSYLLYRMLADAVGTKIIALSATPIINFPQEVAILADLLAGDGRMAEAVTPVLDGKQQKRILNMLKIHPEVDTAEIVPRDDGSTSTLRITPVTSGFRKVVNPDNGDFRGFVRDDRGAAAAEEVARERDLASWYGRVASDLASRGVAKLGDPTFTAFTRLPDLEKQFTKIFIDTDRLEVKESMKLLLMARLSGLISYYKGGKADLMASSREFIVEVDMSEQQLKEYTDVRNEEITKERRDKKLPAGAAKPKDTMYDQVNKSQNSTFKIFSRAACNFAFPSDMERPRPSDYREALKMIGARPGASGDAVDAEADRTLLDPEGVMYVPPDAAADAAAEAEAGSPEEGVAAAEPGGAAGAAAGKPKPKVSYEDALLAAIQTMKENAPALFAPGSLRNLSPKFQAILDRLRTATGPVLVYSNFKTLEGVGLFGLALETQQNYTRLDIVPAAGGWTLSPETLAGAADTPRYISYTGDEDRDKRNILLAIFNGKWNKVPGALAAQVQELTGVKDNKAGQICKVIMITQSGAEGISLSNVRQVHIMEPYWNYVRLDQVKGRAIRICSHMDLPVEQRHVDTYIYISKFSDEQKAAGRVDKTLFNFDEGLTTDQGIWNLMNAKKKLADSILDVMKRAAVDCELNTTENGGYACYRFKGASMEPMFHPLIDVDIKEGAAAVRAAGAAGAAGAGGDE